MSAISANAFSYNTALTCIMSLGHDIKVIEDNAFAYSGIVEMHMPSSLNDNDNGGIKGYGLNTIASLSSLQYDNGVKAIAPSAMINCVGSLGNIHFPSTLTSIGEYAFAETLDVFP